MSSKKPAITPRATKASSLRTQKQQTDTPSATVKPKSRVAKETGASAGVKAFMAQQRARLADVQQPKQDDDDKKPIKRSNVMTGAQRYGGWEEPKKNQDTDLGPKKLQVLIKQAKSSGSLKIDSKGLSKIPEEVLKMYHVDPSKIVVDMSSMGDSWYDAVDLTKFNAGDNEITEIDERFGEEFISLNVIDFRSNQLKSLPASFSLLVNLTSLQLPYNRFDAVPPVLGKLTKLKELNLSHNAINHIQDDAFSQGIEVLDLSDNQIRSLPFDNLLSIRKLNLSGNQIEKLPTEFKWTRLEELLLNKNRLKCLYAGSEDVVLPSLVRLDVGQNNLEQIIAHGAGSLSMPKLIECSLVDNKLTEQGLQGLDTSLSITTLDISSNQFSQVPPVVYLFESLTRLDIRGNQLRTLPYELGKLEKLAVIHCEGNPMRAYTSTNMTQLVESLKSNYLASLEQQKENSDGNDDDGNDNDNDDGKSNVKDKKGDQVQEEKSNDKQTMENVEDNNNDNDIRANPTKKMDLSNKKLVDVTKQDLQFEADAPATLLLDHNELTQLPTSPLYLQGYTQFLVHLNLEHNRLLSFSLVLTENAKTVVFQHLKTLKLGNNRIKQLEIREQEISFPQLEELNLNHNALVELPETLPIVLPKLRRLTVSSNKLDNISAASFKNMEIVDLSNNDIGYLPPELALIKTIKELVVYGNRFRIPRPAVVDQGTRAIMEFLSRRIAA